MRLLRRRTRRDEPTAEPPPGDDAHADLLTSFDAAVDREWERLAAAGTWWTGEQRVAIAREARAALAGEPATVALPDAATEAARRVAAQAATIRRSDVENWGAQGLQPFAYVELVGVVSRLAALDVASFGLGREPRPLPEPRPGEPSLERPADAAVTTGWAPTVGPASAPSSLTAVPAEAAAMFDLHGVLYASIEQMLDLDLQRDGLGRAQIELVAARTSRLNDCFY